MQPTITDFHATTPDIDTVVTQSPWQPHQVFVR